MSYEIVYDKLAIDMGGGLYMVALLSGANNDFTVGASGRERRSRTWSLIRGHNGALWQSQGDWKKSCENTVADSGYEPDDFCRKVGLDIKGSSSSYKSYEGLFVGSFKKSITFEKLVSDYDIRFAIRGLPEGRIVVADKAEFMDKVLSGPVKGVYANIDTMSSPDSYDFLARNVRADLYPVKKREKTLVSVDHYFVIDIDFGYFAGLARGGVKYSFVENGGARFRTEKDALAKVKYIEKKRPGSYDCEVVRVDEPCNLLV